MISVYRTLMDLITVLYFYMIVIIQKNGLDAKNTSEGGMSGINQVRE